MVEASKKVRHPRLALHCFVSSRYRDTRDSDAEGSLVDVPDTEVEAAHMRRGSVMLAAELIIDQCIQDLQLICFGDAGLPDPDMAESSFVYEEFPIRHRRAYDQRFFRNVLVTAVKVAQDIADPHGTEAACIAEEIIRYVIGSMASSLCEDAGLNEPELHLENAWLDDLDFEYLFDDDMDGIENDPARQAAWGVYLPGAEGWFSPFNNDSIVHPYAETQLRGQATVHDLLRRVDGEARQTSLDSPMIDSPDPLAGLRPASKVVALARAAATTDADGSMWVPDETDPERSYATLVTMSRNAPNGSGWLTWEPHHDADVVRTDPVTTLTPHRHFPVGHDEPWIWASIDGGRILAIPLAAVVSYRPDHSA